MFSLVWSLVNNNYLLSQDIEKFKKPYMETHSGKQELRRRPKAAKKYNEHKKKIIIHQTQFLIANNARFY